MASKYLRGWGGHSLAGETLAERVIILGTLLSFFFPLFFDRGRLNPSKSRVLHTSTIHCPDCCTVFCFVTAALSAIPTICLYIRLLTFHSFYFKCTWFFFIFLHHWFSFDSWLQRAINVHVIAWMLCCLSVPSNNQFSWLLLNSVSLKWSGPFTRMWCEWPLVQWVPFPLFSFETPCSCLHSQVSYGHSVHPHSHLNGIKVFLNTALRGWKLFHIRPNWDF